MASQRVETFLRRTDPLAVSAMRKVCAPGKGSPPILTRAERAALDRWLDARLPMLVEVLLHDGVSVHNGKGGAPPGKPWSAERRRRFEERRCGCPSSPTRPGRLAYPSGAVLPSASPS